MNLKLYCSLDLGCIPGGRRQDIVEYCGYVDLAWGLAGDVMSII